MLITFTKKKAYVFMRNRIYVYFFLIMYSHLKFNFAKLKKKNLQDNL